MKKKEIVVQKLIEPTGRVVEKVLTTTESGESYMSIRETNVNDSENKSYGMDTLSNNVKDLKISDDTRKIMEMKAKLGDIFNVGVEIYDKMKHEDFDDLEKAYFQLDNALNELLVMVVNKTLCDSDYKEM